MFNHGHWIGPAVSAGVGLACLILAVLIRWVGDEHAPRTLVVLTATAVNGLLGTGLGRLIQHGVNSANHTVSHYLSGYIGPVSLGLLALIPTYVVYRHWHTQRINDRTYTAAAALPLLVTFIPGTVGHILTTITYGITDGIGAALAWVLGY